MTTPPAALFEDPWADTSMRRTIPLFARLGAVVVLLTAPFLTDTRPRALALVGLAGLALVSAEILSFRGWMDRIPHEVIFVVLAFYCAIVASAVLAANELHSPYRLFYVLPVSFTAAFFTGPLRFAMVPIAALIDYLVLADALEVSAIDSAGRALVLGLLALFSAMVADILREALRTNRALHSVLEAASGHPLTAELAEIGVDAALAVSRWDAGAVILVEGHELRIAALRGASAELAHAYEREPLRVDGDSPVPVALRTGEMQYRADVPATMGPDHPITKDGFRSIVVLPLAYHGEGIGVLVLTHRSSRRVGDRERDRLERVGRQLGLALGNAESWQREAEVIEQLRQLNRQKDDFLANVSHELRTPATAIRLVTATLTRAGDKLDPAQRAEMAATLERRSMELSQLIESLLEESVAESGTLRLQIQPIEWTAALRSWAALASDQTGRTISVDLPDEPIGGRVDAAKVERAVTNLLVNASKFSAPDTPIHLRLRPEDDGVAIEVEDRGIGIPTEHHDTVFERFHQLDGTTTRKVGGFGIGLSLVRLYTEAHGGSATVSSEPGIGSTFRLWLPSEPRTTAGQSAVAIDANGTEPRVSDA